MGVLRVLRHRGEKVPLNFFIVRLAEGSHLVYVRKHGPVSRRLFGFRFDDVVLCAFEVGIDIYFAHFGAHLGPVG